LFRLPALPRRCVVPAGGAVQGDVHRDRERTALVALKKSARLNVRAGRLVVINVVVSLPGRARVSALWLGISTGTVGGGPNGPTGINPVLVHSRQVLTAGRHSFRLRWRAPAKARPGSRLYLAAAWASRQPPGFSEEQLVARVVLD
jgi:hypothetical protein